MRMFMVGLLAVALLAPLGGCYSIRHVVEDGAGSVAFSHQGGDRRYHFTEEGRNYYLLYGLLPIYQVRADTLLEKHVRRGATLANLRIEQQLGPVDVGITVGVNLAAGAVTAGLGSILGFSSRTVRYEGDVFNREEVAE